ncbi:MAG: response regulator, partial [Gemmatimonadaceae bacterium]
LVVEDEANSRLLLRRSLERAGYSVAEAVDGHEALEQLRRARPSLILLDLLMPRMDGFAFLDELRTHDEWRDIPVVAVSAKTMTAEDRARLGDTAVLQKGAYTAAELLRSVSDVAAARD